jgi:hypothetical protein
LMRSTSAVSMSMLTPRKEGGLERNAVPHAPFTRAALESHGLRDDQNAASWLI